MTIEVKSEADMRQFGQSLAKALRGGEVIELIGDVGAGKTTFVKGLAAGLDIDEDVQSPSFTISRVYETPNGLTLVHYDFYRLQDPGILLNELAENQTDTSSITVIEWADIVEGVLPSDRIRLSITASGENSRTVQFVANDDLNKRIAEAVKS